MTETKGSIPIFQESLPEEIRYSYNLQLDNYLAQIDSNMPKLPDDGVSVNEVPGLIGFEFGRSDLQVLRILQYARKVNLIKTEPSGQPMSHKYKREHLLAAAAVVQIKSQGVIWSNMPYVLYHYLADPALREVINKPREPYRPARKLRDRDVEMRRFLFDEGDRDILIPPDEIDLSAQTVLADIPEDFLQQPEPVVATEDPSVQQTSSLGKESVILSSERLGWLRVFLTFDSPIKPPQMDTISEGRFINTGFNIKEIEAVFDEYDSLRGVRPGTFADEYKTYYALEQVLGKILRSRGKIQNRR